MIRVTMVAYTRSTLHCNILESPWTVWEVYYINNMVNKPIKERPDFATVTQLKSFIILYVIATGVCIYLGLLYTNPKSQ